jgi:hypothetical protein
MARRRTVRPLRRTTSTGSKSVATVSARQAGFLPGLG